MKPYLLALGALGVASLAVADDGQWTRVTVTDVTAYAIHMSLLPSTDLLIWSAAGIDLIPAGSYNTATETNNHSSYENHNLFCSGHLFLENGTLFVAGGHFHDNDHGLRETWMYDYVSDTWSQSEDMAHGRWYPTAVMLPNRRVLILAGTYMEDDHEEQVPIVNNAPDMWVNNAPTSSGEYLVSLTQHDTDNYYPWTFIDPKDGNLVFTAHGHGASNWLSNDYNQKLNLQTLAWSNYATIPSGWTSNNNTHLSYNSGVMIDGVVYRSGGSFIDVGQTQYDATTSTIYCDLKATTPSWSQGPYMNFGRKNNTLVGLPNGFVLAMGGNKKGDTIEDTDRSQPEWWNPASGGWTLLQDQSLLSNPTGAIGRGYHSTALLLPDARVVFGGGEPGGTNNKKLDFFNPPYGGVNNWETSKPTITELTTTTLRYRDSLYQFGSDVFFQFTIGLTFPRTLSKIALIALGSTTHAHNMSQNVVFLDFSVDGSTVTAYGPDNTWVARPGPYMLFAVDSAGIPSYAPIVFLKDHSMIFTGVPTSLVIGTANEEMAGAELFLGDNDYLGNYISSNSSGIVEAIFEGTAGSSTAQVMRAQVEIAASNDAYVDVYFWHWGEEQWYVAGCTGWADDEDGLGAYPVAYFNGSAWTATPFIRSSDNKIKIKLQVYSDNEQSTNVFIDSIELGVQ